VTGIFDNTFFGAPTAFHVMIKPGGARCNLKCGYCYYLDKQKLYPHSSFRMDERVLREFIRQYIASQYTETIVFEWQGGEPTLLGLDFFRNAIDLQRTCCPPGKRIRNSFQTNGTLLDDQWCRFFKEHDFLVGISIDGPAPMHDPFRVTNADGETCGRVVDNVHLLKKFGVEFNILCCVHSGNVGHPAVVYRFFRNALGARFLQFIPIVKKVDDDSGDVPVPLTAHSISGSEYGEFLVGVFDEWVKRDVAGIFVQIFDAALAAWYGNPTEMCVFAKTCGNNLAVEHTGDVYSCDHFVTPGHLIGNILDTPLSELAGSALQRHFGEKKAVTLPAQCGQCRFLFACNGECPKNRLARMNDEEGHPLNHLCEGYRRFFTHIEKPMEFMAGQLRQQRPPAAVMSWMAGGRKRRGR